jgi:hypothetical protein
LRYHYLPPAIFAILLCVVVAGLLERAPERLARASRPAFLAWLALAIAPYYLVSLPPVKESLANSQAAQYRKALRTLETAIRDGAGKTEIYIANEPFRVFAWKYTPKRFPGLAGLFIISYPGNVVDGKRIYFLEESSDVVEFYRTRKGSRIAELLVHAPAAPPGAAMPGSPGT